MNLVEAWYQKARNRGMTVEELAKVGECDVSTLERWKKKIPKSIRTFLKIQEHLSE